MEAQRFSEILLTVVVLSVISQVVFSSLYIMLLPTTHLFISSAFAKFEITTDIWVVENMIFLAAATVVRHMN